MPPQRTRTSVLPATNNPCKNVLTADTEVRPPGGEQSVQKRVNGGARRSALPVANNPCKNVLTADAEVRPPGGEQPVQKRVNGGRGGPPSRRIQACLLCGGNGVR